MYFVVVYHPQERECHVFVKVTSHTGAFALPLYLLDRVVLCSCNCMALLPRCPEGAKARLSAIYAQRGRRPFYAVHCTSLHCTPLQVSMSAMDHTGKQYLTAFGEAGDVVFGRSPLEVRQLEIENPQVRAAMRHPSSFAFTTQTSLDCFNSIRA